jgi:hypothetical protein
LVSVLEIDLMSDCSHCDIHDMLQEHLQGKQPDLSEIAAKVTEVLAALILMARPAEQDLDGSERSLITDSGAGCARARAG